MKLMVKKIAHVHKSPSGFTIVELLIVIMVIAILAAISIVAYNGIQNRAKTSSATSYAQTFTKKVELFRSIEGTYPNHCNRLSTLRETSIEGTGIWCTNPTADRPEAVVRYIYCTDNDSAQIAHRDFQNDTNTIYAKLGNYDAGTDCSTTYGGPY